MAKQMEKCSCSMGHLILGVILMGVGLFLVLAGILTQVKLNMWAWIAAVWYVVGIFLIVMGKFMKWRSHGMCKVHMMK